MTKPRDSTPSRRCPSPSVRFFVRYHSLASALPSCFAFHTFTTYTGARRPQGDEILSGVIVNI